MATVSQNPTTFQELAEFLFDLLDDIDTVSDIAKSDNDAYRRMVESIQRRRFEVATTDGYKIIWPDGVR